MSIQIYYFSGTGNSFIAARDIAQKIDAELISIPRIIDTEEIRIEADTIGIVFPSYIAPLSGLPLIVERFIKKLQNIGTKKFFAVCTCGGYECVNAIPALYRLRKLLRACGGELSEEYSVRMPMNNLDYDHIPVPIIRDQNIIIDRSKRKIEAICKRIINKRGTKHKLAKTLFFLSMTPLYRLMRKPVVSALRIKAGEPEDSKLQYNELVPLSDRSITVNENCVGCGRCAKVCPVKNIKIIDGKPEFQHECEMCFACDEWCPSGAIHHWSRAAGVKYRHPEVKLSDMIKDG